MKKTACTKGPGTADLRTVAMRVFNRLQKPQAELRKIDADLWGVILTDAKTQKPVARTTGDHVAAFISADWIVARTDTSYVLSTSGRKWLLRQQANSDAFQLQHQVREQRNVTTPGGVQATVVANCSESPLSWLRARKDKAGVPHISDDQFKAGERLRRDFTYAQMSPKVTANWAGPRPARASRRHGGRSGAPTDIGDRALVSRQNFYQALDGIGPELSGIVVEVCCFLHGLESAEKRLNWPRRSGKLVLQLGLTALARHYGYSKAAQRKQRLHHWGRDGFKPELRLPDDC